VLGNFFFFYVLDSPYFRQMSQSIESVKYFYEYYIQRLFRKFVAKARRHGIIFNLVECLGLGSEDKLVSTGLLFDDEGGRENGKKEGMER
jgi:hypothetical protein